MDNENGLASRQPSIMPCDYSLWLRDVDFEPWLTDPELIVQPIAACLQQTVMWSQFALIIDVTARDDQLSQLAYHVRQVRLRA